MFAPSEKPTCFSGCDSLLANLEALKENTEPRQALSALTFVPPLLPPVIYLRVLRRTKLGLAPYVFQEFRDWDSMIAYLTQRRDKLQAGQSFDWSFYDPHRREKLPALYVISLMFGNDNDLIPELIISCGNCKHKKGLTANKRQIGCKCAKHRTKALWSMEFPPIFQKTQYGFVLYPKSGTCPHFLWERANSSSLKWHLRQTGHEEVCYFCNLSLAGVPEEDVVIHHKKPLALGGSNELSNLEFAHRKCHDDFHKAN